MASICARGGLNWALGRIYSLKRWLGIGTWFPGRNGGITKPESVQKIADMAPGGTVQWVKILDIFYSLNMIL